MKVDTETKEGQNPVSRRRPFVLEHPRDFLSTADTLPNRNFTPRSDILEKRRQLIKHVRFVVNVSSQEGSFRTLGIQGCQSPPHQHGQSLAEHDDLLCR